MGETRVDLLHLLEDLRDAYPGATEETILTEIVANALDSGAKTIAITTDASAPALTIADDGVGMRRRDLARYHDIASSTKVRGAGIGFAGVGIKIALLVCADVITETRRGKHHVASTWRLASHQKAPWRWIPPPGLVDGHGTAVRLTPTNALSPLVDPGFVEGALRRNFQPLFDPALADALRPQYPRGVTFTLNGRGMEPHAWRAQDVAPLAIRVARKRKPAGAGYLTRDTTSLPEDLRGVAVSTYGKVIKRGWDWLGVASAGLDRVGGLMEVPALAECLTLNKADFIRAGARGGTYLSYRKAIQEAVSRQLTEWGQAGEPDERTRRRAARPVERDLETVLAGLADDFPLLASLVEQRTGGQRRLPVARAGGSEEEPSLLTRTGSDVAPNGIALFGDAGDVTARELAIPEISASSPGEPRGPVEAQPPPPGTGRLAVGPRARRPARYGLSIQFEERHDDVELARLIESTVWVNEAHPAYRRAAASRAEGYHVAVAVAMALAPLAVDPAKEHGFVTAFLARWGEAIERRAGRRRPRT
ncbi:MAG TPA: ATP-binding protein [Candidatus Acidoferrum sp.]|nr:ATP-binding protein [Candidatus Acidoferrum sp.]